MTTSKNYFIAILFICVGSTGFAQHVKNKIMIFGSYHMDNPGQDLRNLEADDVLKLKRQQEIKELVNLLNLFEPTKVAVEREYQTKWDTLTNKDYKNYLNESFDLTANEIHQIGFRLAKKSGLPDVECLDAPGEFDFQALSNYAQQNGQGAILSGLGKEMNEFMAQMQEYVNTHSVKDIILYLNSPDLLYLNNSLYMHFLEVGQNLDYPGAKLVSDWYDRNLKIFSNLLRTSEPTGERIVFIIGAGHAPILRQLISGHPNWELIEVSDYVK